MVQTIEPPVRIELSAYYDAAATTREADFGSFYAGLSEDYTFSGPMRSVTLGRLRREIRNNPYLCGLVNKFPEAIGFSNLRSRTRDRAYNDAKDKFWYRWSKSVTSAGDSLRSVEEIIDRELLIAGEVFILLLANGKFQLIPSEFCGSGFTTPEPGEINGIVYAENGLPIGYRFGKVSPAGILSFDKAPVINARFVIHVFHKDRVQMGRGLPWLLASLRPAHDLHEITRSKTKQIKDANSISGTIESERAENILEGMSGDPDETAGADPVPEKATDAADKKSKGPVQIRLENGTFIALDPGEKLNKLTSEYHAEDYKELVMLMLHAISSPVGLPVELWFSGLGDVNYSGFKGLGTQWNARRRYVIFLLEGGYLNRLHFWRISKAANEGDLPPNPEGDDDLIEWAWRTTAVLDEEKAGKANATKLTSGEICLADVWGEKGLYADEVFEHRKQLWIQLQVSAGKMKPGENTDAVQVPEIFLLRGLLESETAPAKTAGSGGGSGEPADRSTQPAA